MRARHIYNLQPAERKALGGNIDPLETEIHHALVSIEQALTILGLVHHPKHFHEDFLGMPTMTEDDDSYSTYALPLTKHTMDQLEKSLRMCGGALRRLEFTSLPKPLDLLKDAQFEVINFAMDQYERLKLANHRLAPWS